MKQQGKEAFEAWYLERFGNRWPAFRKSLLEPSVSVPYSEGLSKPYLLDNASVLAALSLRLPEKGFVLDACAAPGGKSLVIASHMNEETELLCNELSDERRRRLVNVLDEYLDTEKRKRVKVSGFDTAAQGGRKSEHGRFSAILLDAPCSSERHVMNDENALAKWTSARPRSLAQRQWALLSSCFLMLESGGSLVYSTCALSTEENDEVMARLLKKYKEQVLLDAPDFSEGETTEYGRLILPDKDNGMGPMYVARVRKLSMS